MNKYIISNQAEKDIRGITGYIALDNLSASINFSKNLLGVFERLAQMPKSGYKRPEWTNNNNIRFCNIKRYMIVYEINKENIIILRVLNSYRNVENLLE